MRPEFVARAHVLFARSARRSCSGRKIPRAVLAALPPVQAALATLLLFMATSSADAVCLEAGPQGGLISVSLRHFPMEREFQASTFVLTAKVLSARDDFSDHPGAKRYYPAHVLPRCSTEKLQGKSPRSFDDLYRAKLRWILYGYWQVLSLVCPS